MTSTEIINTLMECTPLDKDVICIINEFLQPPTFKVGSKYYGSYSYSDGMGGYVHIYTVIKKTKCFLTLKKCN
nr:hypothetical protein [Candidatus Dadabacteria bacterium]